MRIFKALLITLIILAVLAGGILWVFRYDIFQFSAEGVIKKLLPDYVHVDRIVFDLEKGAMSVEGFAVRNPAGYHNRYLATIDLVECEYRMRGNNILDGIEVYRIEAVRPHINIERSARGDINLNDMGEVTGSHGSRPENDAPGKPGPGPFKGMFFPGKVTGKELADILELTDTVNVNNGKITFLDRVISTQGYILTFEDFRGDIVMDLEDNYSVVRGLRTEGHGFVNGDTGQKLEWRVSWAPMKDDLTLSSRFILSSVDVMPFKPYFDKYSPVDILSGKASGTLVFDFDEGDIGSTNEIRLSDLEYRQKTGGTAGRFWTVATADIIKYLQSSPGEITFDFRIKGDMDAPRFYPGPYVRKAIQAMTIDTISGLISGPDESTQGTQPAGAGESNAPKSDAEKVVDIIRELMKDR